MAKQLVHTLVDQILDSNFDLFESKIQELSKLDRQLLDQVQEQLKQSISNFNQNELTLKQLLMIQQLCKRSDRLQAKDFKVPNIFIAIAVLKGYNENMSILKNDKQKIRGCFLRGLKKESSFWGLSLIDNMHQSLINKVKLDYCRAPQRQVVKHCWDFICANLEVFPSTVEVYQAMFKYMLMLQSDKQEDMKLYQLLQSKFMEHQYHLQTLNKNFRFGLEFLRNCGNEKELGLNPQLGLINLLKNYDSGQIDKTLCIGSIGLTWNGGQIKNCLNNILKLGITEQNYKILKCFIEFGKNNLKYDDLLAAYQVQIPKIFIFLKFPQLFSASIKVLKEMILGPWPIVNLYQEFSTKALAFSKGNKNLIEFDILVAAVIHKYKQTTLVDDLKPIIDHHQSSDLTQKAKREIALYQWKAFDQKTKKAEDNNGEKTIDFEQFKGITNIGNSCYMNSFLQALFMNKQFRRKLLNMSTLGQEKQVLQKLYQKHKNTESKNINIPNLARTAVRPLTELQRFFSLLLKSKRTTINPKPIKNIAPPEFHNPYQHDTIEFGRYLIQMLNNAHFDNLFTGETVTVIQCPYCHSKRSMKEEFLDLMLVSNTCSENQNQIKCQKQDKDEESSEETIEDLIRNSFHDQYIEGLNCENCNNKSGSQEGTIINKSLKKHLICKYPNFLIITLKRFEYVLKENKNIKQHFKVKLEEQFCIDMEEEKVQYIVYAVIVHRGTSANSGHYFTFARQNFKKDENNWLCLNDSTVTTMAGFDKVLEFLETNTEDTPYIIFGCRKDHWHSNLKQMQESIILKQNLQQYVEQDNKQYAKSIGNSKLYGKIDLSLLKFGTGPYFRKDQDDEDDNERGFGFGVNNHNNPII